MVLPVRSAVLVPLRGGGGGSSSSISTVSHNQLTCNLFYLYGD
jgi:hypothetical protein